MKRPFRHLKHRRSLVWALALLLIAGFGSAIGGIFWLVRMPTAYRTDLVPVGEGLFRAKLSTVRFQKISVGDPVVLSFSSGVEAVGTIRGLTLGPEGTELLISFPGLGENPPPAEITLRSQRLLAAFLSPGAAALTDR